MKEIVHYISNDLMAPDAADNLLDKMKTEIIWSSGLINKDSQICRELTNQNSKIVDVRIM